MFVGLGTGYRSISGRKSAKLTAAQNTAAKEDIRYAFIAEYWDEQAELMRQYQILYFTVDDTIEMFDVKLKRVFLKRMSVKDVDISRFYLSSIVTIHSRQYKIIDYGDEFTRKRFNSLSEKTLALIKPDGYHNSGNIIDAALKDGFKITNMKMVLLRKQEAEKFYEVHKERPFFNTLVSFMTSGRITAMTLQAPNAVQKWRALIGPTNTHNAKVEAPQSLRAKYGTDQTKNAVHGSDSAENGQIESDFYFSIGSIIGTPALFENSTLAIIKPHAVSAGLAGKIIQIILDNGFMITALQMMDVGRNDAAEFLEVYKGVVPEYKFMVDELSSGPCIAIEIKGEEDVVETFRYLCGPYDPELGKLLRPESIRAQYGCDKVRNAIHCTDLEEDGLLEVQYFFDILQKK